MQWSKLKQRIEDRFSNNLKGRLEIFETRYRMGHNHRLGEIWLTLDKERIFSTSDFSGWERVRDFLDSGQTYKEAFEATAQEGNAPTYQTNECLFETLNMSIEDMLQSPALLVRGLGIADARCGKRRLLEMKPTIVTEEAFIQTIYQARGFELPTEA